MQNINGVWILFDSNSFYNILQPDFIIYWESCMVILLESTPIMEESYSVWKGRKAREYSYEMVILVESTSILAEWTAILARINILKIGLSYLSLLPEWLPSRMVATIIKSKCKFCISYY